ncbi:AzlD domain-containing protein [Bacillus methanolicus]|uniref:AzlD domain-containing protein n=1 Tax=Bacillus methanolicus TaxID=1471 RepID=UPI001EE66C58|nr:AzlD domain-containing protein [Bacillus methanolicus]
MLIITVCGTGIVTLVSRVLPLIFLSRIEFPKSFLTWLSFVPVTVMTALLAENILFDDERLSLMANRTSVTFFGLAYLLWR